MLTPELWVAVGLPMVGGLIGYGALRQRVKDTERSLANKADKDVLEQLDKRLSSIEEGVASINAFLRNGGR